MGNSTNTDWVYCLEADTGKRVWGQSYPCPLDPKNFEGGPCATPTVAYCRNAVGDVVCLDVR